MALPPLGASDLAVISRPYAQVINPSCLCSDGTGKGDDRPGYTKLTVDDDRMDAFRKALNEAFNNNTDLVTKYGKVEFLGDLPRGYTLWTHTPDKTVRKKEDARPIELVYGHPKKGKYFRSAKHFLGHFVEIMAVNWQRQEIIHQATREENLRRGRDAVHRQNEANLATGLWYHELDPDNPAHAIGLYDHKDITEAVESDQAANPTIDIPCNCFPDKPKAYPKP
ncbi:hypothetical protein D6C81_01463 [Aureobasidium pullulans]|nr:hypothetical protein D6C81_01463 [Aureobasidium pullulans]